MYIECIHIYIYTHIYPSCTYVYAYIYAISFTKKEAMNLKDHVKGYMGGLERRKERRYCNYIMV